MQDYKINLRVLLLICCLGLCNWAYADDICHIQGGGLLDNLVSQFGNAASGWQTQVNPMAKRIFYTLFSLEFMWQLSIKKVFAGDIEKLWVFFFTRCILGFFFAKYLINPEFYKMAIVSIAKIGTNISGYTLELKPGANFSGLGPSEIMGHFSCLADSIHIITDDTGALQYITLKFTLGITQVLLFIILAFIAYSLMKVILQTYFLLYVGFILTGFAGSSWTSNYWEKYVQTLSSMAIKFLSISLLMGVVKSEIISWSNMINATNGDISRLASTILKILADSFIIALIVRELPEWAADKLTGGIKLRYDSNLANVGNFMSGGGMSKTSTSNGSKILAATNMSATRTSHLDPLTNSSSAQNKMTNSVNPIETSGTGGIAAFKQIMKAKNTPYMNKNLGE